MTTIAFSFSDYIAGLQNHKNSPSTLTAENFYGRTIKRKGELQQFLKGFVAQLDILERKPVCLKRLEDKATFASWISTAQAFESNLKGVKDRCFQKLAAKLHKRMVGLSYRVEEDLGGLSKQNESSFELYLELRKWAEEWKKAEEIFPNSSLDTPDLRQIEQAACYPALVEYLRLFPTKRKKFFDWALRDQLNVDTFVQFPALAKWINASSLSGRLGFWGPALTRIRLLNNEKHVCLPFDGKKVSILDRSQKITFEHNYTLTIEEIFKVFSRKLIEPGHIEFIGKRGFFNYNSYEWGAWNPATRSYVRIDFTKEDFYRQLEEQERLTAEEVKYRYGMSVNPGEYFKVICATRRDVKALNLGETHGWKKLGVPNEDGTWTILSIGLFATPYPRGILQTVFFLTKTAVARFSSHDENHLAYSHRRYAFSGEVITKEQFEAHMIDLKKRLIRIFQQNAGYFQLSSKNCAYWLIRSCEKIHGKLSEGGTTPDFRSYVLNSTSTSVVGCFMKFIASLSRSMQRLWIKFVMFILGGWRSIRFVKNGKLVSRDVMRSKFAKNYALFQPALLHDYISSKKIQGQLAAGNSWRYLEGASAQYRKRLLPLRFPIDALQK